jgi:dolichol-phosphate hexosyltransferase
MKKITVIIPCHNEERGIQRVISGIPVEKLKTYGFDVEILVINNVSNDNTADVARNAGAIVIEEPKKGKGYAIRSGFNYIDQNTDYVVMLDGDDTYKGGELLRMIEPLDSNFCDVVVGSRLGGKLKKGSLTSKHRLANWLYTFLVRYLYQANVTDVLTGYFAWKKSSLDKLIPHLESNGFAIEMEMITKMKKLGLELYSVPITYDQRVGESKISSFKDGSKILHMLIKNLTWSPSTMDNESNSLRLLFKKHFLPKLSEKYENN